MIVILFVYTLLTQFFLLLIIKQYEKEIYKAKTLINNGQIGLGLYIYKKELRKYKNLINYRLESYSVKEYYNLDKISNNLLNASLFLDTTGDKLFHKTFYKKLNYEFLKLNPNLYDMKNYKENAKIKDKSLILTIEKEMIKKTPLYIKYKKHLNEYNKFIYFNIKNKNLKKK